jgi:hypothetical protein
VQVGRLPEPELLLDGLRFVELHPQPWRVGFWKARALQPRLDREQLRVVESELLEELGLESSEESAAQ